MAARIASTVFGLATLLVVIAGVARVAWLEEQELFVSERGTLAELGRRPDATSESVRLGRARLQRDQWVDVELCAGDRMPAERWTGAMAVAMWRPRAQELLVRTELSADVLAHARRNSQQGCLRIGSGRIEHDDEYAVEALWEERPAALSDVPLALTIQARPELGTVDRVLVGLGWLFALGLVLSLALPRAAVPSSEVLDEWEAAQRAGRRTLPAWARLLLGVVLLVAAFVLSGFLPSGAAVALGAAVGLAVVEVALAVGFVAGPGVARRIDALALRGPSRAWAWFPAALLVGVALRYVAQHATQLVPSTGESAVQLFVSWPSGLVSFACLAVLVPLAEEVFFRGFVFGALERWSRPLAFVGAATLFVLAHLLQTWGQWGALVALTVTSLALTGLRWASRSTLVPAFAHLVYNGLLALGAVL
jgi:membrane protease YdiL (CAAX protease family)